MTSELRRGTEKRDWETTKDEEDSVLGLEGLRLVGGTEGGNYR